jgi:DNA-binding MarR family transcriptional regulator
MAIAVYSDTNYRIFALTLQVRDCLLKVRTAELANYGISAIEALALFVIDDLGDGATPAEIARKMFREHNTVMALLDRMGKKGLVTREKDRERRNLWRTSLTYQGKDICHNVMKLESIRSALAELSDSDKEDLETRLKSIRDNALKQLSTQPTIDFP